MEHLDYARVPEPDGYMKSSSMIMVADNTGRVVVAYMKRTGITAPGYPDRACYALCKSGAGEPDLSTVYVLDGGYFYESHQWHIEHKGE